MTTTRQVTKLSIVHGGRTIELTGWNGDHISRVIRESRSFYETPLLQRIAALAKPGIYVDLGAHIGNHTVFFLAFCPSTAVVAVEPSDSHRLLEQNVARLQATDPTAARKSAWLLQAAMHPTWTTCHSVRPVPLNTGQDRIAADGPVQCWTLDDLVADARSPRRPAPLALIKLDLEGLEAPVLGSGMVAIRADRPVVVAETSDAGTKAAIDRLLGPLGYRADGPHCRTPTWLWIPG